MIGHAGDSTLMGDQGHDLIRGGAGNDYLVGGSGRDTLEGGYGRDLLNGGTGGDVLNGGAGVDMVTYVDSRVGVTVDLRRTVAQGGLGDAVGDVIRSVEDVRGSEHRDILIGNNLRNYIYGAAGNDVINTGAGADSLDGGAGNDRLTGGLGNDTFVVGEFSEDLGQDVITDFAGAGASGGDILLVRSFLKDHVTVSDSKAGIVISFGAYGSITLAGVHAFNQVTDLFYF